MDRARRSHDLDTKVFRDSCRLGTGLTCNGFNVPVRGVGTCGHKLYTDAEVAADCCIDCDAARGEAA